jgi:hypothetical protein
LQRCKLAVLFLALCSSPVRSAIQGWAGRSGSEALGPEEVERIEQRAVGLVRSTLKRIS